jgi:hypothetical protein
MGGGYYDRDVIDAAPSYGYSNVADKVLTQTKVLHKSLDPKRYVTDKMTCDLKNPIVFALDVTGSMGDWTKVVYDKMPMFYGQLMVQGYLTFPAISFCAVGDAVADDAPLQVAEFGQGRQIDQSISKMYLEGGGGGGFTESYELAAHFYSTYFDNRYAELPFFFITGDEKYYETVKSAQLKEVFGAGAPGVNLDLNGKAEWEKLKKKFNVFHIHKPYYDPKNDVIVKAQWAEAIGKEHILEIDDAKAVIDVVLGAIAIVSGSRDLKGYIKDMQDRGQSQERIEMVTAALKELADWYSPTKVLRFGAGANLEESKESFVAQIKPEVLTNIKAEVAKNEKMEFLDHEHREYKKDLKDMKSLFKDKIPDEFYCPITGEIFYDPVMTADGHSYERSAIVIWLKDHDTSPITNAQLGSKNLIPNQTLKKLVREFYESNKRALSS